jgi:hypothetical protein
MAIEKEEYYSIGNIIQLTRLFFAHLLTKWWLLIIAVAVGIAVGWGIHAVQKPKYEAVCTFILEEKSTGGGSLAGWASQFGLDVGGLSSGGSIFAGDNIMDILRSRKIVQKVLLSPIDTVTSKTGTTLADHFLEYKGWKKKWSSDPALSGIHFADFRNGLSDMQDSVLNLIHEYILRNALFTDRLNKKGTIIEVQITEADQVFAKLMTDRLVEEAGKLYLDIKTGTALANINQMQRRSDSLVALLNNKSYSVAASQMLDINPGFRTAAVPTEIATRDKMVISTLYAEVTKNLETSKLLLSQQTPIIQILDRPAWPLVDKKKTLTKLCLIGVFVTVVITVAVLGIQFIIVSSRKGSTV